MASMKAEPPMRRKSLVYVEIPPFPLHKSRSVPQHLLHVPSTSTGRKENALLHVHTPHMSDGTDSASPSHKHKLDADHSSVTPPMKKPRRAHTGKTLETTEAPNADEEFPNGFVYCHQCNKKRDLSISIHCTVKDAKGLRCRAKYCKPCLKNRYGLALEDLPSRSRATTPARHVQGESYYFACPRCDDICNCVACRKAKGLQPTGNLANITRQSGLRSAAEVLRQDPRATGSRPVVQKAKQAAAVPVPPPFVKSKQGKQTNGHKARSKAKPVPKPIWTDLGISLSLAEAEERIHIREFMLRFSGMVGMSRTHLDELEEIRSYRYPEEELSPWISESCLKSLVLSLLNLLDGEGENGKRLKTAIKCIRDSGANLNKIWGALGTLREPLRDVSTRRVLGSILSLPDPLPPPASISVIKTRSGASQVHAGNVNVCRTAQLVPVVSAMVEAAIKSGAVRREIEDGINEAKERAKEAREAIRRENELHEQEKASGEAPDKVKEPHKQTLTGIDDALRVALTGYLHRVSPLGRDVDGRTYWALSPGSKEVEAAVSDLASYGRRQGRVVSATAKRTGVVPTEERRAMKKWPLFLAVWGRAPPLTERIDLDGEEGDEEEERWWGFWDPAEIRKLVCWMCWKTRMASAAASNKGVDTDDEAAGSLAKELEKYVTLLECRIRRDGPHGYS